MPRIPTWLELTFVATVFMIPNSALASPWTLPSDELTVTMNQHFDYAGYEYLQDGTYQAFPLDGYYRAQTMSLAARYGFTDRFEGAAALDISQITYTADPLVLDDFDEPTTGREVTSHILDFNSTEFGAGDVHLSGRYNLYGDDVMLTSNTTVKLPTGYDRPAGTIVVREDGTEKIGGQATLGDGQADITQSLLAGTVLPTTNTFVRSELGGRYRFGAPGHQAFANLRVGQDIGDSLIVTGGMAGQLTVVEGEVIGETMIANNPQVPAEDFTDQNIRSEPLRLDRDVLAASAGVLLALGDVELSANYQYTIWGRNTGAVHTFSAGAIFSISEVTGR